MGENSSFKMKPHRSLTVLAASTQCGIKEMAILRLASLAQDIFRTAIHPDAERLSILVAKNKGGSNFFSEP